MLCVDGKAPIRAPDRSRPVLPMMPGVPKPGSTHNQHAFTTKVEVHVMPAYRCVGAGRRSVPATVTRDSGVSWDRVECDEADVQQHRSYGESKKGEVVARVAFVPVVESAAAGQPGGWWVSVLSVWT